MQTGRIAASGRGVRSLVVATCLSAVMEHGGWLALMFVAYERGGLTEAGLVASLLLVPAAVLAPLMLSLADRRPRGPLLIGAFAVRCVLMVAIGFAVWSDLPGLIVYGAAAVAAIAEGVTRPLGDSIVPGLVTNERELSVVNVGVGVADAVGYLIGPVGAGVMLATVGVATIFFAGGALGGVAALVVLSGRVARVRAVADPADEVPAAGFLLDGIRTLAERGPVRWLLVFAVVVGLVTGAHDVATFAVLVDHLGRDATDAGLMAGALGVGGVVGTVASSGLVGARLGRWLVVSVASCGAALAVVPATRSFIVVMILFAISSGAAVVAEMLGRILVQAAVADEVLGRVAGAINGAVIGAVALGALGFAVSADRLGVTATLVGLGVLAVAGAGLGWARIVSLDEGRASVDRDVLAVLRGVRVLEPLPPVSLRVLQTRAERRELAPGDVLFRRGDVGERIWVVLTGEVEIVTVDDRRVVLGVGESFGEIAVVGAGRRTADAGAGADGASLIGFLGGDLGDAFRISSRSRRRVGALARERLERDGDGRPGSGMSPI